MNPIPQVLVNLIVKRFVLQQLHVRGSKVIRIPKVVVNARSPKALRNSMPKLFAGLQKRLASHTRTPPPPPPPLSTATTSTATIASNRHQQQHHQQQQQEQ